MYHKSSSNLNSNLSCTWGTKKIKIKKSKLLLHPSWLCSLWLRHLTLHSFSFPIWKRWWKITTSFFKISIKWEKVQWAHNTVLGHGNCQCMSTTGRRCMCLTGLGQSPWCQAGLLFAEPVVPPASYELIKWFILKAQVCSLYNVHIIKVVTITELVSSGCCDKNIIGFTYRE